MSGGRVQCKDLPDEVLIQACRDFRARLADTPDVALADRYPVKVIMAKIAKLVSRGVLDYGVSMRTAWVVQDVEAEYQAQRTQS